MVYCPCFFFTKVTVLYSNNIVYSFGHVANRSDSRCLESSFCSSIPQFLDLLSGQISGVYLLLFRGSTSVLSLSLLACSFLFLRLYYSSMALGDDTRTSHILITRNARCSPPIIYVIFLLSAGRTCLRPDLNTGRQSVKGIEKWQGVMACAVFSSSDVISDWNFC